MLVSLRSVWMGLGVFGIAVPTCGLVMSFVVLLSQARGSGGAWDFWDFCPHGDAECRELLVLVQTQLWNTWASLGLLWEGLDHVLTLLQSSGCNGFISSLWCTGNPIQKSVLSWSRWALVKITKN